MSGLRSLQFSLLSNNELRYLGYALGELILFCDSNLLMFDGDEMCRQSDGIDS